MAFKYLGPALLLAVSGLYFFFKQAEVSSVGNEEREAAAAQPDLASLEQRLAILEERVDALEGQSQTDSGSLSPGSAIKATHRSSVVVNPAGPDLALRQIQKDFENDDHAANPLQRELEDVAPLFDAEEVASLTFHGVDCRANYCRLEYKDNSADQAESMIAENELSLLLSQKYGKDIVIHGGESNGRSRSLYIELHPN